VILDRNPLRVDPLDLNKINIVRTVKSGKDIYNSATKKI
jgi:predicted amidohydrolase YtcJ